MAKLRFSACHFIPDHPKCGKLYDHTYAINVRIEGKQVEEIIKNCKHYVLPADDIILICKKIYSRKSDRREDFVLWMTSMEFVSFLLYAFH
ncbi:MAG: 6-carboxytetrahydropterin synthase [Euryarchaeota archaeon]|nr:6-carboxytetrahydropterin synthase [Euryarchaeota archaeon]